MSDRCLRIPYHPSDPILGGRDLQERLLGMIHAPGSDGECDLRDDLLALFNALLHTAVSWDDIVMTREELLTDLLLQTIDKSSVLVIEIKWKDRELPHQTADYRRSVLGKYANAECRFVFASPDAQEPQDSAWARARLVPVEDVAATRLDEATRKTLRSLHTLSKTRTSRLKAWLAADLGDDFPARLGAALGGAAGEPFALIPKTVDGRAVPAVHGGWDRGQYLRFCPERFLRDPRFVVADLADRHTDMPFVQFELCLEEENPILMMKSMARGQIERKERFRGAVARVKEFLARPARRKPSRDSAHYLFHQVSAGPLLREDGPAVLGDRIISRAVDFLKPIWPAYRAAIEADVAGQSGT